MIAGATFPAPALGITQRRREDENYGIRDTDYGLRTTGYGLRTKDQEPRTI